MKKKMTVKELLEAKGKRKIVLTTAFDYYTAKACDQAGVDIIVTSGLNFDTLEGLKMILTQVRKAAPNTLIGAGLPKTTAFISESEAMRCALFALDNGADLIYSSGMEIPKVKALTRQKIPFVGHVGLFPVYATWFGGMRAVGKSHKEAIQVYEDTLRFQDAGAIAVEMECVPERVATKITKDVDILTFSMGSGPDCDGQFNFSCDILGSHDGHYPRHSKKYCDFYNESVIALSNYRNDIDSGSYPEKKHVIAIKDEEYEMFLKGIGKDS